MLLQPQKCHGMFKIASSKDILVYVKSLSFLNPVQSNIARCIKWNGVSNIIHKFKINILTAFKKKNTKFMPC